MPNTWLVIANASQATIYQTELRPKTLSLVKEFIHPPSREKGEALASDRAGHYQGEAVGMEGTTHGAFNESTDPKSYEHERFASEIAKELDAGRTANSYKNLIIVASPHFHGLLNKSMNSHVSAMVGQHIQKDYTALSEKELLSML